MKLYVIVTRKGKMELDTHVFILDHDQEFAFLALMEGSKGQEALTNNKLIPEHETEEELVEKMVELLLKILEIDQNEKGYAYLKYMLKRHVECLSYSSMNMGDGVYPDCAKHFDVSPKTVAKHANRVLKDSIAKNKLTHIALWASMIGEDPIETLGVSRFLIVASEKIRTVIRNNLT